MDPTNQPDIIAHTIQLAVAPVFLLAGIGALLNVLTTRLGRSVDRARFLEAALGGAPSHGLRQRLLGELKLVDRRIARINIAVTLCTLGALLVCLVIMALFTGELWHVDIARVIAALFIASMASLISALGFFLAEISIAIRTLRVRTEVFTPD